MSWEILLAFAFLLVGMLLRRRAPATATADDQAVEVDAGDDQAVEVEVEVDLAGVGESTVRSSLPSWPGPRYAVTRRNS